MWACGTIIYQLLGGYKPFQHENIEGLFRKIRAADYCFHDNNWQNISVESKRLIHGMLAVDPRVRLSVEEALDSTWMKIDDDVTQSLSSTDLSVSLKELRSQQAITKFKSAVHAVSYLTNAKCWATNFVSFMDQDSTVSSSIQRHPKIGKLFNEIYDIRTMIQKGNTSTVWRGINIKSNLAFAIKIVDRSSPTCPVEDLQTLNEVAILRSLASYRLDGDSQVVPLLDFFEEDHRFCLVMELVAGGDLFERIVKRTKYTEECARNLTRGLCRAVAYIHSRAVVHRDLKPQNLLLEVRIVYI